MTEDRAADALREKVANALRDSSAFGCGCCSWGECSVCDSGGTHGGDPCGYDVNRETRLAHVALAALDLPALLAAERERVLRVDPAEIDAQRAKGWPDFHPEDYCHRCGYRNVYSWHAPNDLWNRVIGGGDGIVCPQCFTELAKEVGVNPSVWHLEPAPGEVASRG